MHSRRSPCALPGVMRLEERLVQSTGVSATVSSGVLRILGTAGPDVIEVRSLATKRGQGHNQIAVAGVGRFPANRINSIAIDSGAESDTIRVVFQDRRSASKRLTIDSGAGDDRIEVVRPSPAGAPLHVNGGTGDDVIEVAIRKKRGVQLDGGEGVDVVNGVRDQSPPRVSASSPLETVLGAWEQEIVDLTNAERARAGLPPLRVNARLVQAAAIQANQMSQLDRMAHTLTGAEHPTLFDRLRFVSYGSGGGENVAFNYRDPRDVMLGWMYSSSHRANILRASYREIGVAVAYNAEGLPYFAQVFGMGAS